jgi:hypothetical protein
MNRRIHTIACALLLSALAVPAADAGQLRTPAIRHSTVSLAQANRKPVGGRTYISPGERALAMAAWPHRIA